MIFALAQEIKSENIHNCHDYRQFNRQNTHPRLSVYNLRGVNVAHCSSETTGVAVLSVLADG